MSSQKVKEECYLQSEENKAKKRWKRKTKKDHLNKKVTLMKMCGPSRERSKKNGVKPSPCPIRYRCERHGNEMTREQMQDYLDTVELSSEVKK